MAFKGVTFAGQNVTPKDDGALYMAHYGDGILDGCSMAISGDDLVIQSGHFIAGGRQCHVDGATNVDLSTRTLTNGYIQVVMDYDISKPEGNQWNIHMPLIESATTTFPALTKDDINGTGTLYQLQLAIVQISGGNLTSIYSQLAYGGLVSHGVTYFLNNITDDRQAKIDTQNIDGGNGVGMGLCTSNGDMKGGFIAWSDGTFVLGGGDGTGEFIMRPNGFNSTVGQVKIDKTGQFVGGALRDVYTRSGSTNIPSSGWVTIVGTGSNKLVSSGLYIVETYFTYNPNTSTTHTPWFRMAGVTENRVSPGNLGMPVCMTRIVTGVTEINVEAEQVNSAITSASIAGGATIIVLRIA